MAIADVHDPQKINSGRHRSVFSDGERDARGAQGLFPIIHSRSRRHCLDGQRGFIERPRVSQTCITTHFSPELPCWRRRRALADCPPASRIPGIFTAVSAYHVASQAGSPPIASPTALRGLPCHKSSTARRRSTSPHQRGLFEQDACTVRPRNARMHSATFNPSAAKAR